MDFSNLSGAPLFAAIIVLIAVLAVVGVSIGFNGSVQF